MRWILPLLISIWLSAGLSCNYTAPDPPNIIIILADDLGFADLGCTGSSIPTPNLDQLATDGVLIPHFYTAARCCPSRAALLTGFYPHEVGMGDMVEGRLWRDSSFLPAYQGWLDKTIPSLAEQLANQGYQTFLSGKWHLGNAREHWPDQYGFQRHFAMIHGADNYFGSAPWISKDQFLAYSLDGQDYQPDTGFYLTDLITEYAQEFIRTGPADQPFFLYLSYTAPHWPLQAPPADIRLFADQYCHGWDLERKAIFNRQLQLGLFADTLDLPASWENQQRPAHTPEWGTLTTDQQQLWADRMAIYAAQVYGLDRAIGHLLTFLKAQDQLDNSLIFFLSDNGATDAAIYAATHWIADRSGELGSVASFDSYGSRWAEVSNTPYRQFKKFTTEGGVIAPLIVHWPAAYLAGRTLNGVGHLIDIVPTCLALNGLPIDQFPGQSLLTAISSDSPLPQRTLFWEHEGNWAVRDGDWKLVYLRDTYRGGNGQPSLYNLQTDPFERYDQAIRHPKLVDSLHQLYHNWAHKTGVLPFDSLILAHPL
ncbi:MAG: sulfatase-like hydrolase/transferase [Bacteroidota bacterium]